MVLAPLRFEPLISPSTVCPLKTTVGTILLIVGPSSLVVLLFDLHPTRQSKNRMNKLTRFIVHLNLALFNLYRNDFYFLWTKVFGTGFVIEENSFPNIRRPFKRTIIKNTKDTVATILHRMNDSTELFRFSSSHIPASVI